MGAWKGAGKYLGDAVYGALDGIVTTFAIVAGVAGAALPGSIILILGLANLLGDGVSMAAGNYLSKRSDADYRSKRREELREEVAKNPSQKREELRGIYARKGLTGTLLDGVVAALSRDKKRLEEEIVAQNAGRHPGDGVSPLRAGMTTFAAFVLAGVVPLLSYLLAIAVPGMQANSFALALALTLIALFVVGSLRSLLTARPWWLAGLEMLVVGGLAAGVAYLVGAALKGLGA